jgi:hypothetical protein
MAGGGGQAEPRIAALIDAGNSMIGTRQHWRGQLVAGPASGEEEGWVPLNNAKGEPQLRRVHGPLSADERARVPALEFELESVRERRRQLSQAGSKRACECNQLTPANGHRKEGRGGGALIDRVVDDCVRADASSLPQQAVAATQRQIKVAEAELELHWTPWAHRYHDQNREAVTEIPLHFGSCCTRTRPANHS